ncbi:predicted protein [Naegleria gruberi]|uniref:Predicted protein n=1 Tax=Naegleria gruberi TaxID=5762 RepID=D2VYH1_NAEGR|nr:uncharacterized protein NAEGRDRAFT_74118 [Naegleria gruberi]EFC38059.1 predicted protein [Naegleria gruberi]|eukprot:XP_002670803.1 predicted protein [Naegleria gruberi strain NEG-M]
MESPLKKKKLNHAAEEKEKNIDSDDDDQNNDENVKIILSNDDGLMESILLKKKLGGNKIRTLNTKITLSEVSIDCLANDDVQIRICHQKKLLFLSCCKNIHIYNYEEDLKLVRKINVKFDSFEVDSVGEHLFVISISGMSKYRLDDMSELWTFRENVYCFTISESRNEIFIPNNLEVNVLDMNDGSVKRKIPFQLSQGYCADIVYDEEEETIYLSVNVDSFEVYDFKLLIVSEKTRTQTELVCDQRFSHLFFYERYLVYITVVEVVYLFEKKTNNLLLTFKLDKIRYYNSYFDRLTNTLIYLNRQKICFKKLHIEENIIETPLNKEICLALEKFGGKLPSFIPKVQVLNEFVIPECLQYLWRVEFENSKFWYIEKEIAKYVSFRDCNFGYITERWMGKDDILLIGDCPTSSELENNKFALCIFVKKEEVSKVSNGDFSIYLRYFDESSYDYIIQNKKTTTPQVPKLSPTSVLMLDDA